jgi:hypothetical protein
VINGVFDRRYRSSDPRIVLDHSILDRNIKIDTDKDRLTRKVYILDGSLVHKKG